MTAHTIEFFYKRKFHNFRFRKEWWWKMTCPENGKLTGKSTEGYWNKSECEANLESLAFSAAIYLNKG